MTETDRPKLLVVLTSASTLPSNGQKTGWYLPELVHPYKELASQVEIVTASPAGGEAPLDPYSVEASGDDLDCQDFLRNKQGLYKHTQRLETFLGHSSEFAGIFFVGGHGPMIDLANDTTSHALIKEFYESSKIVSAVCHGPAALINAKLSDGSYMVSGQTVTGFSNAEEDAYKFTELMPFLLESQMIARGAKYEKAEQLFGVKVTVSGKSGNLITGQNPPSAGPIGKVLLGAILSRAEV